MGFTFRESKLSNNSNSNKSLLSAEESESNSKKQKPSITINTSFQLFTFPCFVLRVLCREKPEFAYTTRMKDKENPLHYYNVEVYLDIKKLDERSATLPTTFSNHYSCSNTSSRSFGIDRLSIYFKGKTEVSISLLEGDHEVLVLRGTQPLMVKSLQIDYDQQEVMPLAKTHLAIRKQLQGWRAMPYHWRERMITHAMCCIEDMVKFVSPPNNVLDVGVKVLVKYNGTFGAHSKEPLTHGRALCSMDVENGHRMSTTATDLPIISEGIKEYYAEEEEEDSDIYEVCPICFEGMFASGRAALVLGCTHKFHVYCISEWAMTNRSCPICRYKILRKRMGHDKP